MKLKAEEDSVEPVCVLVFRRFSAHELILGKAVEFMRFEVVKWEYHV